MYAMVCTRPDLAHAVGVVSRFLSNPGKKHWEAVKWIFRYLRGTSKLGITFGNGKPMLVGYTDSDLAGNKDNMKSTSGYLMTFAGGAVSWQSRLQKCVALSTTEAEYVAATEACKELLWLKRFLQELGFKQQRYAVLCDNQSTIHLAKNSMFHKRTKHIDIRYHWIRDAIEDGMFELNKVHTDDNASDMLTKAVARTCQIKMFRREYIRIESSTQHSSVNEFVVIYIPEEDVKPKQIILDPDDQPMWENAKIVAPTPNSAIVQSNVDDNFVINSTHLNMIRESKFDGYLRADPHDHIYEFLIICDMFKYGETQSEVVKLLIFPFSLCDEAKTWYN
ncbi:hypothetical protein Tco_0339312, partial [Tanacetum coccineum]